MSRSADRPAPGGSRRADAPARRARARTARTSSEGFGGIDVYTWTVPVRMFGRCAGCKARFVVQDVTIAMAPGDRDARPADASRPALDAVADQQCPAEGFGSHVIKWEGIRGTVNGQSCSAKCHESASPVCKCSCGGAEHGSLA